MSVFHLHHPHEHSALDRLAHGFWAMCGSLVILFIFFAALGAIDPTEAVEVTVVVLALAVLRLAHAWRELWRDERRGT
jgi:hypothetical protein